MNLLARSASGSMVSHCIISDLEEESVSEHLNHGWTKNQYTDHSITLGEPEECDMILREFG